MCVSFRVPSVIELAKFLGNVCQNGRVDICAVASDPEMCVCACACIKIFMAHNINLKESRSWEVQPDEDTLHQWEQSVDILVT